MLVCDIDRQRLEKLAAKLCEQRNKGLPIEHGKASYQIIDSGVVFSKAFFKLDSNKADYSTPVAKVELDPLAKSWNLYIYKREEVSLRKIWQSHPVLSHHRDFAKLIAAIEDDSEDCIWY